MEGKNNQKTQKPPKKSFEIRHNPDMQCTVFNIIDAEGMYPILWIDPERGTYRINRTRNGLQMTK